MEEVVKSTTIKVFRQFPRELFRVNRGWNIVLRPQAQNPSSDYDIITRSSGADEPPSSNAQVEPKALDPENYNGPNGALMMPNTAHLQYCISKLFRRESPIIYKIQEGTILPDDLLLVRDTPDGAKWSLQPAQEMTLGNLNQKITQFLRDNGAMMTRQQWAKAYPKPTEPRGPAHPLPKDWKVASGSLINLPWGR